MDPPRHKTEAAALHAEPPILTQARSLRAARGIRASLDVLVGLAELNRPPDRGTFSKGCTDTGTHGTTQPRSDQKCLAAVADASLSGKRTMREMIALIA